jgi:hypothetical protein
VPFLLSLFLSLALTLAVMAAPAARESVIAIGDIHGDLDAFGRSLRAAGLTDQAGRWIGGRSILVQTGDYMDRGSDVRQVLEQLMALEAEAKSAGGRAIPLLGNHEVMNLLGEFRDVAPAAYGTFGDADSDARREAAWQEYQRLGAAVPDGHRTAAVYQQSRDAWMTAHPAGFIEYREALAPRGRFGASLRKRDLVVVVGDSIFMHAGLAPATAPPRLLDLNAQLRSELRRFDEFLQQLVDKKLALPFFTFREIIQVAQEVISVGSNSIEAARRDKRALDQSGIDAGLIRDAAEILKIGTWVALDPQGPLWYRGLSTLPDAPSGDPFEALLQRYRAVRFVTGHSPTADQRIDVRFGGRSILIDTSRPATFRTRPSALRIEGSVLTAIYEDERVPLTPVAAAR